MIVIGQKFESVGEKNSDILWLAVTATHISE